MLHAAAVERDRDGLTQRDATGRHNPVEQVERMWVLEEDAWPERMGVEVLSNISARSKQWFSFSVSLLSNASV